MCTEKTSPATAASAGAQPDSDRPSLHPVVVDHDQVELALARRPLGVARRLHRHQIKVRVVQAFAKLVEV
jgi:hypothetical protein